MYKRIAYYKVKQVMDEYRIPILVGLRRTGKTTILKQLSEEYDDAVIIRFDSFDMQSRTDIEAYNFLKSLIASGKKVLLIDEIQVRSNWDSFAKNLFDEYMAFDKKIKVVITGSSSLSFENKDTGIDRTKKVLISSMDFKEYLEISKKEKNYDVFEEFLGTGGFPGLIGKSFSEQKADILEPILNDDIPSQYKVSTGNISRLLNELAHFTNGEFNKTQSAQRNGVGVAQINNYLDILQKCQIIKIVDQINENGDTGKYPKIKIYINPHFHLWILNKTFNQLEGTYRGHIIESYWLFAATQINGYHKHFYYLKDSKSNKKIDFVSLESDLAGPIKTLHEFKYKDHVSSLDVATMLSIPSQNKVLWTKFKADIPGVKVESIIDYENKI